MTTPVYTSPFTGTVVTPTDVFTPTPITLGVLVFTPTNFNTNIGVYQNFTINTIVDGGPCD